jgi:hypothetical protein
MEIVYWMSLIVCIDDAADYMTIADIQILSEGNRLMNKKYNRKGNIPQYEHENATDTNLLSDSSNSVVEEWLSQTSEPISAPPTVRSIEDSVNISAIVPSDEEIEEECGSYFTKLFRQQSKELQEREKMQIGMQNRREKQELERQQRRNNVYARKYKVDNKDPDTAFQLKLGIVSQMRDNEQERLSLTARRDTLRSKIAERQKQRELVITLIFSYGNYY